MTSSGHHLESSAASRAHLLFCVPDTGLACSTAGRLRGIQCLTFALVSDMSLRHGSSPIVYGPLPSPRRRGGSLGGSLPSKAATCVERLLLTRSRYGPLSNHQMVKTRNQGQKQVMSFSIPCGHIRAARRQHLPQGSRSVAFGSRREERKRRWRRSNVCLRPLRCCCSSQRGPPMPSASVLRRWRCRHRLSSRPGLHS